MRERVTIRLGGRDYDMLPSFGVLEAFEDRHGSIAAHLARLVEMTAPLSTRAFLVLRALEAGSAGTGDGKMLPWGFEAVKLAMFEAGLWHESLVNTEIALVERLLYTPEQYTAKKALAAEMAAAQKKAADAIASSLGTGLPT